MLHGRVRCSAWQGAELARRSDADATLVHVGIHGARQNHEEVPQTDESVAAFP
jgi:hypothetical protein